ncbi:hypothetical protein ACFL4Z_03875 [candidate division KSB1 bacterium]
MYPKAGYLIKKSKKIKLGKKITNFPTLPIPQLSTNNRSLVIEEYKINEINDYSYFIPIERENICLGLILVDKVKTKKEIDKGDLKIVAGYASLAALAINDYLVTSNLPDFQEKISEILGEFKLYDK